MRTKILAVLACVLWGSAFAGAKYGFEFMEPIRLSGLRFTLAGLMLMPLIMYKGISLKSLLPHMKFILFFAFIQTYLQYGVFFMGLNKVPAATSAVIVGAGPLFIALMAHFTMPDDKLGIRKIISIILGLSGVVFISLAKGSMVGTGSSYYLGIGLLVFSNLIGSTTNIVVAKRKSKLSPIALTSLANFFGGLMLLVTSFFVEESKVDVLPLSFYAVLLWLAFIPAAGFSIWYTLLQKPGVKVSDLNMWKFIIPVTGCLLSWAFIPGEYPDVASVVGILSISSALLLLQLPTNIKRR